jgi:triosephosphate isomerase
MKPIIVANWKCNPKTIRGAKLLFRQVKNTRAIICPPFVYLATLGANGSQDCFWEERGAYTGEISPAMLKDLGVKYVILGHSERRKYQKETNEMIEKKTAAALRVGLKPILCIDKISQLPKKFKNIIVAYEPLFAIGTGKACSPDRARKMRLAIKKIVGPQTPILYGGSVNGQNALSYIKEAGFQGLLVGGASLKPKEFVDIVKNTCYPER